MFFLWTISHYTLPKYGLLSELNPFAAAAFPIIYCLVTSVMDLDMWFANQKLEDRGKTFQITYKGMNLAIEIFLPLTLGGTLLFFFLF
ncbi:MAG: hypothetical protein LBL61_04445 [Elusimicrobiota bacterium]|nr:hypothetical protein [Elusimicrobiota bacterium]